MNKLDEIFYKETGENDDDIISSFLLGAEKTVLAKTNRKSMIDELEDFKLKLAITRYNQRGNEGLSSYSEGGESESYLSEDDILSGIGTYRLTAIARRIKDEKEKSEDVQS